MRLTEIEFSDAMPVEGYGPGFFRVGGQVRRGPLLLSAAGPSDWGGYGDSGAVLSMAGAVDVLFVGTGADISPLPPALRAALEGAGIGVEVMASPTACRSYNLLLAEGRRVALAALPV